MKRKILERVTYTLTRHEVEKAIRDWLWEHNTSVLVDDKTGSVLVLGDGGAVVTSCEYEKDAPKT